MRLQEFPRPAHDNGWGIHFGLDVCQSSLDMYVPKMVELGLRWCLVAHTDELQLARAAQAIWSAGIMPVLRWVCSIDQNNLDFARFVSILRNLNIPPYIQIFNEPGDQREWKNSTPNLDTFVAHWVDHASRVASIGGFPGLQVLAVNELRHVLRALKSANATNVIERMWFCAHPYGANHPPDYPYDARNQQDHPDSTVFDDDTTVLSFLTFADVFKQELGFVPPMIAGKGGWQYSSAEDSRYPAINDTLHAQYHAAMFNAFRTNKLPNGMALPDYLFAFCPWILYGGERDAWYSWTAGTRQPTIAAIKSLTKFVRQFNWDTGSKKSIAHYLLFDSPPSARDSILGARKYILKFGVTLGFDANAAANAQYVTIVGRANNVGIEAQLKSAGCRVERIDGDQYAIDATFAERVARGTEFGL